tara:strand:+ start:436 stop:2022 length:1587 start_codon:yes stop_codon:yes gene_type:complete
MKSKKNKLTNLLKTGILFFGISLLLWNCQTENEVIENNEPTLLEKLQNNFNLENFKEALPYDFEVNWNNTLKQYSQELETSYYEFPITYTSKFNPDEIIKSQKSKYNISYKILITENEKQEYKYYVVKFYNENSKSTSHLEKNFAGSSDFSGFIHLLNKSGDIVFAKKFEGGIEDSKKFYNKEFKEKRNKDENLYARVDETCTTVTTHSWTDNYVRWGNETPILVSSTYNGSTTTESCESYWLPDLNIFGGGGSGLYIKSSSGGIYNDCNTPSCRYEIRDLALECGQGYVYDNITEKCVPVQIKLDSTFENSVANCAYKLLKDNKQFNKILDKLIPKNSKYHVTFKVGNAVGNAGHASATYSPTGNITVVINKDLVDTGNIVSIAETILHESVHARLFELVKSIGGLNKLNEFANEDSEIGKLAACYNKYRKKELQHEFIWSNYVSEIAKGTEAIHKLFPENYDRFHDYMLGTDGYTKESFYQSVAKAGLNKTSYFKSLSSTEQETLTIMYGKLKANGKKITNANTCE